MEREILFIGKRVDNGEWVEGHLLWYEDGRARIIPRHTDIFCYKNDENTIQTTAYEVIPETVGQDTGLTDKNGEKIFEWDIVDILRANDERGLIEWDTDTGRFIVQADTYCIDFDNYWSTDFEIIGNIHDNPDLIA